ncbi:hypothetical protein GWI33_020683 [Rhynchophorus ferrugineus]|uniref:TIL domain-containing protein n=1 Tax=Rhynchophorus ferrugineus TaxID=354439 RepID=A0A834HRW0_RHYFE|nr:hypothetical protein GWI33_020683 [Rhynchophorus ferrugineus]
MISTLVSSASHNLCGKNTIASGCGSPCQPTCSSPPGACIAVCVSTCNCKPGYVRHDVTNECILKSQCPK